ncbi:MAG: ParB/RepB/Spo0J family partition protein [Methylococcaceae bacterium]|nr:ParB/RepB/Spo0J family partition protein [Methylococcaceae bacterium]MCI0734624.1 ParB/RepB/Spo0J family partition protein [Methylococcaceae bacterium]
MPVKKRGLGRGLNALLGEVSPQSRETSDKHLPVERLQRGKYQPRKDIDQERLQELADSISAQGVIQPIVVRRLDDEKYEIVAGERRWRAAQLAGLHEVPVIIRNISDQVAMALALIENIQREDLNPLEEAEGLDRLLTEFNMTHQQVADAVGKSRTTVTNLLRLLDLQDEVKDYLAKGRIEMGHARALLGLDGPIQIQAARKVAARGLNVRATEKLVRNLQAEGPSESEPEARDPDIEALETRISEKLGARVAIQHKASGKGRLVISYTTLEELEGVLERMN